MPAFPPSSDLPAGELDDAIDSNGFDGPSKTRMKKDSHELQKLGEALAALPQDRLDGLDIPERLLDAVNQYKVTKTFEAKRRQMQYIGKLMRLTEVDTIRDAVTSMQLGQAKDALALHQAERWRAELLDSDDHLTRWMAEHPTSDLQQLRSLVRAARKDAAAAPENRSGRAYRELFQAIKQVMVEDSSDPHGIEPFERDEDA
jgi:ribosome-associated protein